MSCGFSDQEVTGDLGEQRVELWEQEPDCGRSDREWEVRSEGSENELLF